MRFKSGLKGISSTALACVLGLATLPSFTVGDIQLQGGQALAQTPPKLPGCKAPPEKRRLKTLSQSFFKKVEQVDNLTNPPESKDGTTPEPDYRAAWPILQRLLDRCEDCNEYESAQLFQRAAFIQYQLENVPLAIDYFKRVVQQSPNIPESLETQLLYQIAQLLTQEEKYQEALDHFARWEAMCPAVVPRDYFFYLAQIYFQMGQKDRALSEIEKAIKNVESQGEVAPEQWYRLQLSVLLDKEDFVASEKIAEKLVVNYTNYRMISQLAQIYGVNGKENRQLALTDALNVVDQLSRENEYRNLAYQYLSAEAPYLASRAMKKGLEKDVVKRSATNLETLAVSLTQAYQTKEAIPVMEEAAGKADSGKLYGTLAAIYLDTENYAKAIESGNKAINKGGLRSEGEVYMYMGSAYIGMERFADAIPVLRKAAKDEKYQRYASDLIRYANAEKKRQEDLKKSAAKVETSQSADDEESPSS